MIFFALFDKFIYNKSLVINEKPNNYKDHIIMLGICILLYLALLQIDNFKFNVYGKLITAIMIVDILISLYYFLKFVINKGETILDKALNEN